MVTAQAPKDRIDELITKVDALRADLRGVVEAQRRQQELIDEMMPILKQMISTGAEKLETLEQRGYFAFGKEALNVLDRIVTGFTPDDVAQLGDNVVHILNAVKHATQPKVLAIADEAAAALESYDENEPITWRGMFHASRDEDVQRGLATAVAVLRRIGRMAAEATDEGRDKKAKLAKLLAPTQPRPRAIAAPAEPQPAPPRSPPPLAAAFAGEPGFDAEGFLVDAEKWTPDLAAQIARASGCPELTEAHWKVIEFARAEYATTKKSPNVRRLAAAIDGSIKGLYALFPNTPGKTAARIAGLPKPGGCI